MYLLFIKIEQLKSRVLFDHNNHHFTFELSI